ncbi:MAG TPA: hypothetical protein VLA90_09160 [Actinomycetota bacterium]|nr:hypothetical protein [Actinomycetota bacterium]
MPETRAPRGSRGAAATRGAAAARTAAKSAPPPQERSHVPGTEGSGAPVCTVAFCPICLAVTAAQGVAPDAMDHLLRAARELFLAARAVMDARADDLSAGSGGPTRLEKIDIA